MKTKIKMNISKKALRVLNIGLPFIAAFFGYILYYSLSDNAVSHVALTLTERAFAAVVLLLTASHIVNYYEYIKNR